VEHHGGKQHDRRSHEHNNGRALSDAAAKHDSGIQHDGDAREHDGGAVPDLATEHDRVSWVGVVVGIGLQLVGRERIVYVGRF
jgi:hypothetical protein